MQNSLHKPHEAGSIKNRIHRRDGVPLVDHRLDQRLGLLPPVVELQDVDDPRHINFPPLGVGHDAPTCNWPFAFPSCPSSSASRTQDRGREGRRPQQVGQHSLWEGLCASGSGGGRRGADPQEQAVVHHTLGSKEVYIEGGLFHEGDLLVAKVDGPGSFEQVEVF